MQRAAVEGPMMVLLALMADQEEVEPPLLRQVVLL
jgi:hypothetical protein